MVENFKMGTVEQKTKKTFRLVAGQELLGRLQAEEPAHPAPPPLSRQLFLIHSRACEIQSCSKLQGADVRSPQRN